MRPMTVPQLINLSGRQLIQRELADGLEHPEPGRAIDVPFDMEEALVDQIAQRLKNVGLGPIQGSMQDLRRSREAKSSDEDSEAGEYAPLGRSQEVIAPVDCGLDRSLSSRSVGRTDGESGKPLLEPKKKCFCRDDLRPSRSQLDRSG